MTTHFHPTWEGPILEYIAKTGCSTVFECALIEGCTPPWTKTTAIWFVGIGWLASKSPKHYALACAQILAGELRVFTRNETKLTERHYV